MSNKRSEQIDVLLKLAHELKYPGRYDLLTEFSAPETPDPIFDALHEAIRLCAPNPFADARELMAKHFMDKREGAVYHTYLANISMAIYDYAKAKDVPWRVGMCDTIAARLMYLIFEQ